MFKKELRKEFLTKRLLFSRDEIELNSSKIFNLLCENFDLKNKNICTFLPIISKNEINTFQLFDIKKEFQFNLFSTKWNIISNELSIHRIINQNDLIINEFNIPEPKESIISEKTDLISIVLVPLLCFDKQGNRIGYGKGVYDQFLSKFNQNKTLFVGLSIFEAIEIISDPNDQDVKLHYCITPKNLYRFEK
jgi:5-formyltetrahydrofolate cyclo-ligase